MSEQQPVQPEGDQRRPIVEDLAVSSEDPAVLARWEACLAQWGYAFVAFSQLRLTEIYTEDVTDAFEGLFGGTYDDLTQAAVQQVEALGWSEALDRLREAEGISDDLLIWNYRGVVERLRDIYSFEYAGEKVHFFAK
jgi:hypothetical protein